jgi:hypothetical protein
MMFREGGRISHAGKRRREPDSGRFGHGSGRLDLPQVKASARGLSKSLPRVPRRAQQGGIMQTDAWRREKEGCRQGAP